MKILKTGWKVIKWTCLTVAGVTGALTLFVLATMILGSMMHRRAIEKLCDVKIDQEIDVAEYVDNALKKEPRLFVGVSASGQGYISRGRPDFRSKIEQLRLSGEEGELTMMSRVGFVSNTCHIRFKRSRVVSARTSRYAS